MASQILKPLKCNSNNIRIVNKLKRLEQGRELTKYYNHQPFSLSLKQIKYIKRIQSISNLFNNNLSQLNFEFLANQKIILSKIKSSKNISQLLYYVSLYEGLQLTIQQQKHFDLKSGCDKGLHYRIADCNFCNKRYFIKTSCNSFFCEDCRKYISSKIKRKAKSYIWNCNHFFATFTLPPEIQERVERWDRIFSERTYKNKSGNVIHPKIYYCDLVYKSVDGAIKEYCKKHNLENGFILMPHSYGSLELNWNFHINALISSKAFKNNKIVDYQFNYNELRSLYQKHLLKNFKTNIKDTPQVRFAKRKGSIYISYKKSISKILNYFRHIPIGNKNIIKIENGFIYYRTSKAKKLKKVFRKPFKEFFNMVMQHIPPSNFRTLRQYGLYSNKNKKRKQYPISKSKPNKSFICDVCKTPITKRNFIGLVHNGNLVWVNPELKKHTSIFNYKDFDWLKLIEIEDNGKVMQACEPPDSLKPKTKPEFPEFDGVEDTDNITDLGDYEGFGIDKIDLNKFAGSSSNFIKGIITRTQQETDYNIKLCESRGETLENDN